MKQLISTASNLLVAIHDDKTGRHPIPMSEVVVSTIEHVYRLINNQMVREPVLTDHRFTVDRPSLKSLIKDLEDILDALDKLNDHFDESQATLPL